jgi:putative membrane protein
MAEGDHSEDTGAARRTELARERTALAWWRSGITALGVSVAVGRVVPALGDSPQLPYSLLGTAYALVGLVMIAYGSAAQRAERRGTELPSSGTVVTVITVLSVAIAIGTLVVLVAGV